MNLVRSFPAGLLIVGFAGAAAAAPDDATLLIRAGHVLDVESGRMLADQDIRIEKDRVVSIAAHAKQRMHGVKVLDWSALTVVPGLMDMHTHLADEGQTADPAAPLHSTPARDALIGASNARLTVQAGFTTVRDVGVYRGFADVALRDAINAGLVPGPRMFVAGGYITVTHGGGEITGLKPGTIVPDEFRRGVADNEGEVRRKVNALLDGGADFIKVIATGAVLTAGTEPGQSEYSESEIRAAVEEAAKRGTFVAAHAHGAEGIKRAVRAGVRSIEHGSLIDDEGIALMKEHGTWLDADIYNGDYIDTVGRKQGWSAEILRKNTETTDAQREGFRKAVKAGVNISFGTDAGVYPYGDDARQFAYMIRYGLTPLQAIRSATIDSARLLGKEKDLGSIAVGKIADLVAVACDPIKNIECLRQVRGVVKDGKPVARD
ncbi:amidohydrolase family protein [Dokdonella sp.]|mgnify:FL=1|uniref:Xaa-Pro dipeptidase n=1 Tax=Dokdonella sp. TaxID=2291710 RepID=UPI002CEF426E|nr:amidohydrolase family protein [Dokdonella sp.]HPN80621.1 amidohydrolase family protein [Dokdonella sp.]